MPLGGVTLEGIVLSSNSAESKATLCCGKNPTNPPAGLPNPDAVAPKFKDLAKIFLSYC